MHMHAVTTHPTLNVLFVAVLCSGRQLQYCRLAQLHKSTYMHTTWSNMSVVVQHCLTQTVLASMMCTADGA